MSTQPATPPHVTAAELCRYITLTEEGKKALQPELTPEQFAELLIQNKKHADAVQVIAHYLPKRQAVYWALTCVRQAAPEPGKEAEAALEIAERWVKDPTEENRTAALKAADAADSGSPAGSTALAAYYTEGLPKTEDPRNNARAYFLTARLVTSAVLLSATSDPDKMPSRFESFVAKGLEFVKKSKR